MADSTQMQTWCSRYLKEGRGLPVVAWQARKSGTPAGEALNQADEAISFALERVLVRYGDDPGRFASFDHFHNTVTKIAINWLRGQARKRKNRPIPYPAEPASAPGTDPRLEAVRQCLERLPAEQQHLLRSRFEEGVTQKKLAEQLLPPDDRTANARQVEMHHWMRAALDALRAELLSSYPELGWAEDLPLPSE